LANACNCATAATARDWIELEHEISVYLKHIPPYFFRLNENANRLFFDSSDRLEELERQLAAQRERFKTTKWRWCC
jgi:hypothetical protein